MNRRSSQLGTIAAMFVTLFTIGCRDSVVDDLQGRWIGQPDTAAALASREAKRYHDPSPVATQHPKSQDSSGNRTDQHSELPEDITNWERYDVRILLNFVDGQRLEMSLADGTQPVSGEWRIVQSSIAGLLIEVETKTKNAVGDTTEMSASELRRFELQLDYVDGTCVGFRLNESGADPSLGAIYFTREE